MKIFSVILMAVLFFLTPAVLPTASAAASAEKAVEVKNRYCPVSGDKVNKRVWVDYQGKRYSLCCRDCVKDFKKDPKKYIEIMKQQESSPTPPVGTMGGQH